MNSQFNPKDLLDIPDPFAADSSGPPHAPDGDALPTSPTRARTWALRATAVAAAIACEAVLLGVTGFRRTTELSPTIVGYGVVLPLAAAGVTLSALQRSLSRKGQVLTAIGAGSIVFIATTFLSRAPGDESARGMLACMLGGTMMAAGTLLLAVYAMRNAFVAGATWRTAALGLASGLLGAVATRLHCPNDALEHVLVGHGTPILLAVLAAAAIGSRFTRA